MELFGPPERWATTTRSLVWTQLDVLVPGFTGSTTFHMPIACSYDLEVAAAKYFHAVRDGEVPLAFNFNGTIYYRGDQGQLQMSLVPWSCSAEFRLPLRIWHELIDHYYPGTGWVPLRTETVDALQREKARRGHPPSTPAWRSCWSEQLGERRAGASWSSRCSTRATRSTRTRPGRPRTPRPRRSESSTRPPTPRRRDSTFDQLGCECVAGRRARGRAERRGALPASRAAPRHQAAARRADLPAVSLAALLAGAWSGVRFECEADAPLGLRLALEAEALDDGRLRVALVVENRSAR